MPVPSPRQVFDDPASHLTFLTQGTDDKFEGQHFDRKVAGQPNADDSDLRRQLHNVRNEIKETISAFANKNVEGGLLVIGIATDGMVRGIDHLTEKQRNSLTDFDSLLRHQTAEAKLYDCVDAFGNLKKICLIYTPYTDNGICETLERNPKAWLRSGSQNVLMTQDMRDRIKVAKGIVDFEGAFCCPFDADDVDEDVLTEFRKVFHPDTTSTFTLERLLYEAGAIVRRNGEYWFTHAGLLFFASNPQRVLPQSYIRLLRFSVPSTQFQARGLPISPEQQFKGPVTRQIRAARTFFRESMFFK